MQSADDLLSGTPGNALRDPLIPSPEWTAFRFIGNSNEASPLGESSPKLPMLTNDLFNRSNSIAIPFPDVMNTAYQKEGSQNSSMSKDELVEKSKVQGEQISNVQGSSTPLRSITFPATIIPSWSPCSISLLRHESRIGIASSPLGKGSGDSKSSSNSTLGSETSAFHRIKSSQYYRASSVEPPLSNVEGKKPLSQESKSQQKTFLSNFHSNPGDSDFNYESILNNDIGIEHSAKSFSNNPTNACHQCHKDKARCDFGRPCSRCIRKGCGNECKERVGLSRRYTRPPVFRACAACAKSKARCDHRKPCNRCLQRGIECMPNPKDLGEVSYGTRPQNTSESRRKRQRLLGISSSTDKEFTNYGSITKSNGFCYNQSNPNADSTRMPVPVSVAVASCLDENSRHSAVSSNVVDRSSF